MPQALALPTLFATCYRTENACGRCVAVRCVMEILRSDGNYALELRAMTAGHLLDTRQR